MKAPILKIATVIVLTGVTAPALAQSRSSGSRTGINFGASVRDLSTEEQTLPGQGSNNNSTVDTQGQEISAYVGYAFTSLSLGVMYTNETASTHSTQISTDGSSTVTQLTDTKGNGEDLYIRYLFGTYFYFEAGAGLYQQTLAVSNSQQSLNGTAFSGSVDAHTYTGIGPAYHAGGGVELPITGGFYFTTNYSVRTVELFDQGTSYGLGQKSSTIQKSELLFGLAYYDKSN